uniref:Uncharacterized protein n=1 Tax=Anguilla anguilla TaxID=7936 RepID=A0A0E9W5J8_ANGAN
MNKSHHFMGKKMSACFFSRESSPCHLTHLWEIISQGII